MHPVVVHIAGGLSYFSGSLLIIVSLLVRQFNVANTASALGNVDNDGQASSTTVKRSGQGVPWLIRFSKIGVITGLLLAVLSSTPAPEIVWFSAVGLSLAALSSTCCRYIRGLPWVCCAAWMVATILELPWTFTPSVRLPAAGRETPIIILADSVTAGLGEGEATTWPALLRQNSKVNIVDYSHVGETVSSARRRIQELDLPGNAVAILELGGNDILGSTSVEEFEVQLDQLLRELQPSCAEIFLFELPLPPFHSRWGYVQRKLARRHRIKLIPRRHLAAVFSGRTSTIDSIHLSQEGHNRLAVFVQKLLRQG